MNAIEFWILDSAIESCVEFSTLETSRRETLLEMKRPREANNELVAITLDELYQHGDLDAYTTVDGRPYGELLSVPRPTRIEIARSIADRKYILGYGLTAQGGGRWEEVAQPQWKLFSKYGWDIDDVEKRQRIEVECMEAEAIEHYIIQARTEGSLIEETVERRSLVPWEATYWKTLSSGHFARFQQKAGGSISPYREWYKSYTA